MASIFNLLNDWHIGRALLQRYSLFLYVGYILMAAGYGALGLSYLGVSLLPAAARHILLIGTLGFFILTVMSIVGRIRSEERRVGKDRRSRRCRVDMCEEIYYIAD